MKLRKLLTSLPLLALTILPTMASAGDWNGRNYRNERDRYERDRYDRNRDGYYGDQYRYNSPGTYRRPMAGNRDGVVTRREWRGNNNSFRRLDRNHDGVLSEADRRQQQRDNRYYDWRR